MASIPGLPVLCVMAAVWAGIGVVLWHAGLALLAGAVVLSAVIALAARGPARRLAPRSAPEEARIGRLVGFWSMAEGVAIAPVALILANTGRGEQVPAAIAIIVGLHFLPLARGMKRPVYYATGAAMIGLGVAGLGRLDGGAVALGCAGVLWATCLAMIGRAARRPAGAGG